MGRILTSGLQAGRRAVTTRLTTNEAAIYLYERHGIRRAVGTLRKIRVTGGGPACFRISHNEVLYTPEDLDRWVAEILIRHTSTKSRCTPTAGPEAA